VLHKLSFFIGSLFLCFVMSTGLMAQSAEGEGMGAELTSRYRDLVSFDYELEDLASLVNEGRSRDIPKDRILIINGTVSSRQLIDPTEESYFAILELSSGDWEDEEELRLYRCYIQLIGPSFAGTVPDPQSRTIDPKEVPLHADVLLIGRYLGYGEDETGDTFPVLEAVDLRVLE